MGGADENLRKPPQQSQLKSKLQILLLVITTNLITIYLFKSPSISFKFSEYTPQLSLWDSNNHLLLHELNTTQSQLAKSNTQLTELRHQLHTTNSLLETLLSELGRLRDPAPTDEKFDIWGRLSGEVKLAAGPHKLPLGFNVNMGSDQVYVPLGSACFKLMDELTQYMNYEIGGECPTDDVFAQQLMLQGCEPLPRRRCHPKAPKGYVEPVPFPASLWTTPPDTSIVWHAYTCKSYQCLIDRKNKKGSYDCTDCFDLNGREKTRWLFENGDLDYSVDNVLRTKPPGTIRIGLDIGGGSGTFAARMRERNVTIITTSMNFDGPFNSFISSRGLLSVHVSVSHRLPFFENTLDIVHSMHVLSNWIPDIMLEFILYDIYRVLRPGGLFWLDHFFCIGNQMNATYVPIFDRIGFKKVRWNAGRKLDRGIEKNEWYLSALLEKPMT